jgi:hypothetical protein
MFWSFLRFAPEPLTAGSCGTFSDKKEIEMNVLTAEKALDLTSQSDEVSKAQVKRNRESIAYRLTKRQQAKKLADDMMPEIFSRIRASAASGKLDIGIHSYEFDEVCDKNKVMALWIVMHRLEDLGYAVLHKSSESYRGEGNNMSDFHTSHQWTIIW